MEQIKLKNIPKTIYLVLGDDAEGLKDFKKLDTEYVLWCEDRQNSTDLEYRLIDADQIHPVSEGTGEEDNILFDELYAALKDQRLVNALEALDKTEPPMKIGSMQLPSAVYASLYHLSLKQTVEDLLDRYTITKKTPQ